MLIRRTLVAAGFLLPILSAAGAFERSEPTRRGAPTIAPVQVEILENLPAGSELDPGNAAPTERYTEPAFGFARVPTRYSVNALPLDRSTPFVLRATLERALPAGEYEFRLRSKGAARFLIDGQPILETKPQKPNTSADDPVPPPVPRANSPLRPAPYPHQEAVARARLDGRRHRFELVAVIGGKGLAPAPEELSVSVGRRGEIPRLLGGDPAPRLTDAGWEAYAAAAMARHRAADVARRRTLSAPVVVAWNQRHRQVREWVLRQPAPRLPRVAPETPVFNAIDRFIGARLEAAKVRPTRLTSDLEFLRRVTLDTIGVAPTPAEIRRFRADPPSERRRRAIDRLLDHPGWADHWLGYWQDVLAENPGFLKPDLNNSGPFRWWLHQSFTDNLPFDRLVAELVEMDGSAVQGGPAGFGQATLNDAPMAAKADVLARAFLGQNLSCARCHDAPHHPFKQRDLFSIAAMLDGKPVTLPATSTVPIVEGFRKPLVPISLRAGEAIAPTWPFESLVSRAGFEVPNPGQAQGGPARTRRELAALIVSPENERFAQVVVNRLWKRYFGIGLVEPVDDWHNATPSHRELLRYLARELLLGGYDLKRVARLILSSHAYQRKPPPAAGGAEARLFAGPARRRLSAEQLVDSLYRAVGKRFDSEELNLNPAGDRPLTQFLNLGVPCRAWEFTALSNERDRPALALPISQSIVDVLTAFGWRQSRQNPTSARDDAPSPMQTLILANGIMGTRIVRLSDDSLFTELCLQDVTLEKLVRETFLRLLSRQPSAKESRTFQNYLRGFYRGRRVAGAPKRVSFLKTDRRVSWSNHLSAEATVIRMEEERRLRLGDAPTQRLTRRFRERFEDVLWALVNSPEFVVVP